MNLPPGTFTFYNNFENCPHKAWRIYVVKDIPKGPQTPAMKWGNDVHSAMEKRLRDDKPLPENMQQAEKIAASLCDLKKVFPIRVEAQLAVGQDGTKHDYWKDPWLRGKLDFVMLAKDAAWMLDWKTGKVREEPFELEVGALLLKAHMPGLTNIVGAYFWMQEGKSGERYDLNKHEKTWDRLRDIREQMNKYEGPWPKRKNPLCGWCPVKDCENNRSQ